MSNCEVVSLLVMASAELKIPSLVLSQMVAISTALGMEMGKE